MKKIFKKTIAILVIALLFASCSVYVNCNFNKVPKYKTTQQDSTVLMINEYWFQKYLTIRKMDNNIKE